MLMCFWRGRSTPAIRAMFSFTSAAVPQRERLLAFSSWLLAQSQKPRAKSVLTLALFMFRDYANHPHYTLAVDDLALVANFLYRCSYFHNPAFSCQLSAFSNSKIICSDTQ